MHIYRNASEAFVEGLRLVQAHGRTIVARGHEVRELRPHALQLERPLERVCLLPHRRNNIFTTIAETLWVIAGRNDLDFLSFYLPSAKDFSDDGITWRAAYGPRLRNWSGNDQFHEVIKILKEDPNSRRAVMSLYDPAADFISSKDIPCNNWLHFLIRDGKLHLHVVVRSNDAVWGFSGINTFEWSVVHEMMAYWTGAEVGSVTYFVSSWHLYKRHYERADEILLSGFDDTPYSYGFSPIPFGTPFEQLDRQLESCFQIEASMRAGVVGAEVAIDDISDRFLQSCMKMLAIFILKNNGGSDMEVARMIEGLPHSDFRLSALEFFARKGTLSKCLIQNMPENDFLSNFWRCEASDKNSLNGGAYPDLHSLLPTLSSLHREKTRIYKDAWKRRGEVIGVLSNIARKFDRLEIAIVEGVIPSSDETLMDTVADLAIYAAKYLTFLAEHYDGDFQDFSSQYPHIHTQDEYKSNTDGFDAVWEILMFRHDQEEAHWNSLGGTNELFSRIAGTYKSLEEILLSNDRHSHNLKKCELASDLAVASLCYLRYLAKAHPSGFLALKPRKTGI